MYFTYLFSLLALAAVGLSTEPSSGCSARALPQGQKAGTFHNSTINGRRYLVYIPKDYKIKSPTPLVLSYHGGSKNPEIQKDLDQMTDPKYNTNRMIVYPDGTPRPDCAVNGTCYKHYWSIDPDIHVDDVAFTTKILRSLKKTYCIDEEAIFATGKSQGAGLIGNIFACNYNLAHEFAAFAPVSGAFYTDANPCEAPYKFKIPCDPGRSDIPMIEFHGGEDTTAPYTGGPRRDSCLPNIPWWVKHWATIDGIQGTVKTQQLFARTPNTRITRYGSGSKWGLVQHIYEKDIGHDWPSTTTNSDNEGAVAEFNATPIILRFFDSHHMK